MIAILVAAVLFAIPVGILVFQAKTGPSPYEQLEEMWKDRKQRSRIRRMIYGRPAPSRVPPPRLPPPPLPADALAQDKSEAQLIEEVRDDATRMVYADWLEQRGELIKASYVRGQPVERDALPKRPASRGARRSRSRRFPRTTARRCAGPSSAPCPTTRSYANVRSARSRSATARTPASSGSARRATSSRCSIPPRRIDRARSRSRTRRGNDERDVRRYSPALSLRARDRPRAVPRRGTRPRHRRHRARPRRRARAARPVVAARATARDRYGPRARGRQRDVGARLGPRAVPPAPRGPRARHHRRRRPDRRGRARRCARDRRREALGRARRQRQ